MAGREEARLVELVDQARPRAIDREADEWERRAHTLEEAVRAIEAAAARHPEIGGQTGPAMAQALAVAADALSVKARDLHRGSQALRDVAHATQEAKQERERVDQRHPRQGGGEVVLREEESRRAADDHENAFRRGIAVMKEIQVGKDPRTATIPVETPVVEEPTRWRSTENEEKGEVGLHPGDPEWDDPEDMVGGSAGYGMGTVALGGAGALGLAAGAAGAARAAASAASAAPAAALGRMGGMAASAPAVLGGAGAMGGGRGGSEMAGGAPGRTHRAARGGGGGLLGGRRGGKRDDEAPAKDRDLHDDGEGWLDDEGGPGILR
ncbi:hypothetical protein [Nocardioides nanhaiensis]|uniref:PPE domain-containing protein n=1 Tax=Nocardioides nanhaiensis TaxID=1476871 RepID=A0ABP8WE50_9ACTN